MDRAHWDGRSEYGKALEFAGIPTGCEEPPPARLVEVLGKIDPEVTGRFSGCGSPIPEGIEGCRVVDLGCGTGRDVYLCAALAGPSGFVLGLDSEADSLAVARRHVEETMRRFGHSEPNVAFRSGSIEALHDAGINDEDFDVAISNRALNLTGDRLRALREIHRVLKPGGEFYFSDVYSDRRLPDEVAADSRLSREALGGAVYIGDFFRLVRKAGFSEPRIVLSLPLSVGDPDLLGKLGRIGFRAVTLRLFKAAGLEDGEEDYGQSALYRGTIPGAAHRFLLDAAHPFETGRSMRVGGNTSRILEQSRFAPHFKITGGRARHFGPFSG